jgi:peptidoglycan/LPS O-acetylase OafA/YrhL
MQGIDNNNTKGHLKFLDSARGIAALMVFFSHFIARTFQDKINVHYFFFVFNGNDAVSFFFVLSGFVLSYKYIILNKPLDIKQFYVNRVFRLFPAYFLTVLVSAWLFHRLDPTILLVRDVLVANKTGFWEEALLFRFHNNYYYPGWTLTIEMLGSFLIPFYIALAIKNKKFIPYLIVVTLIIGNNIFYSYLFLFGILACTNYHAISADSFRQTKWFKYRYSIIIAAILLFSIRQFDAIFPFGPDYKYLASYLGIDFFTYTGLACFVFLVAILHSKKTQRFLNNKVLVFLGKISYGIYLVHPFVITALYIKAEPLLVKNNYNAATFIPVALISIAAVILVATCMHYWIELPFIRLGKRITRSMKPSLVIRKEAI